ncbi:para [Symbiodinium sp. CCMP2592]|nr:para [Symbiodinium sp. CCMP2592]
MICNDYTTINKSDFNANRIEAKTEVGEVGDVEVQYQDVVTQVAESVQVFKKAADCPDEDVASTVPDESEEQDLHLADRKQLLSCGDSKIYDRDDTNVGDVLRQQQQAQQSAEGGEEDTG